jgi:hypothetical protein
MYYLDEIRLQRLNKIIAKFNHDFPTQIRAGSFVQWRRRLKITVSHGGEYEYVFWDVPYSRVEVDSVLQLCLLPQS